MADSPNTFNVNYKDLIAYTDWERQKWHEWLSQYGDGVLKTSIGEHGDGRFQVVGDCIRHIFSAEKRYVDRPIQLVYPERQYRGPVSIRPAEPERAEEFHR